MRKLAGVKGALCRGLVVATILASSLVATPAQAQTSRPNILVIVTDDQRWNTLRFMPNVRALAHSPNATLYRNAFAPNPLCCPGRASILSGNHSHTHGVWSNQAPFGGFGVFDDRSTIATDFDKAGYRTGFVGKYLNGYPSFDYVPPGWDSWFAVKKALQFYDYSASKDGQEVAFGHRARDHIGRVLGAHARLFVRRSVAAGEPFFLYLGFTAPHLPAVPDPADLHRFDGARLPGSPSRGVRGSPPYLRAIGWNARRGPRMRARYEKQAESIYGVDRHVGKLLPLLPPNTIVVFLSDNGFLWGEHRWSGKQVPYNESLRIPMVIASLDGSWAPALGADEIALNIDLRPTLTAAAGVRSPDVDGIDWAAPEPRSAFPIEHRRAESGFIVPDYCGVRELGRVYVRYASGFEELYFNDRDPFELRNVAATQVAERNRLRQLAMELCNPAPPGYSW